MHLYRNLMSASVATLLLINVSAHARPNCQRGFYADILVGYGSTSGDKSPIEKFEGEDNGFAATVGAGYHFARYFGVEVNYQHFPTGTNNQDFGTIAAKFIYPITCSDADIFFKIEPIFLIYKESDTTTVTTRMVSTQSSASDEGSKRGINFAIGSTYWLNDHWGVTGQIKFGVGDSSDSIGKYHILSGMIGLSGHV